MDALAKYVHERLAFICIVAALLLVGIANAAVAVVPGLVGVLLLLKPRLPSRPLS